MKSIFSNTFTLSLILVLVISGCQTPKQTTLENSAKADQIDSPLATMLDTSEVFSSNFTGFALYDPQSDSLIYGQNENQYFTPASNTKLFTFFTGLKLLPDSLPALEYVVRGDSLIFWGTGDPSFLHPEFGKGKVYKFLKNREEDLYFSDSNFDDKRLGPGWAWDDYNYYYQTEISPLPMYGNTASIEIESVELRQIAKTKEGKLAIKPAFFRSYIEQEKNPEKDDAILSRNISGNNFQYKPESDTTTYTIDKPYHYTPQLVTDMLSDTLDKPVEYLENVRKTDSTKVLYSISSDTAYKRMLRPSDNFIAEQLLLVAASELGMPLNSSSVIEEMKSNYLNFLTNDPQWVDGSGLSRYNMITPHSMVQLLNKIDDEFTRDEDLFHLLAAGGKRGTIKNWYEAAEGNPPYVFAKTGTLSNNHCLSGYLLTESGKKLIFSFMNNHYITSSNRVKEEMEKMLEYIYRNF